MADMTDRHHISAVFSGELRSLKQQILTMGRLVDAHVGEAVRALLERDRERAARVVEADRAVNQMELAIDEQCIRILALHQPAASDLRFIAAALKMVTDLERIGDLAVNMAERAQLLAGAEPLQAAAALPGLAGQARTMLADVLDAFVAGDTSKAQSVIHADADVDATAARCIADAQAEIASDPGAVGRGVATIFFAKHIERLADHATNIAEMVVYLVRGQDVRHARST
jgi:phosphate transport system protein